MCFIFKRKNKHFISKLVFDHENSESNLKLYFQIICLPTYFLDLKLYLGTFKHQCYFKYILQKNITKHNSILINFTNSKKKKKSETHLESMANAS